MFAHTATVARRGLALAAFAMLGVGFSAQAQTAANWPAKPVRVVVADFRKLLVNEGTLLSALIKEQKIVVD